jgi:hypothetical protein
MVWSDEMKELVVVTFALSSVCGTCSTLISELMRSVVLSPETRPSIASELLVALVVDIAGSPGGCWSG